MITILAGQLTGGIDVSFLRDFLEEFSFTRLGDLRAKVVGSAVGDKRPTVRWPEEIASFKKNVKKKQCGQSVDWLQSSVDWLRCYFHDN